MSVPPTNSIQPATLADWCAWLEANHPRPEGVWLITYRPATGKATFTYEQAVEEALCYGWIDGLRNRLAVSTTCRFPNAPTPPERRTSRDRLRHQRRSPRDVIFHRCRIAARTSSERDRELLAKQAST